MTCSSLILHHTRPGTPRYRGVQGATIGVLGRIDGESGCNGVVDRLVPGWEVFKRLQTCYLSILMGSYRVRTIPTRLHVSPDLSRDP